MGDYWDFPRGNIRENETAKEAALRETEEETGLSIKHLKIVDGFEERVEWFYRVNRQKVHKKVTYFLAETERESIKISDEHVDAKWLSFKDSLTLLKYKSSRNILQKAEEYLNKLV